MNELRAGAEVQARVIGALILRETKTLFGRHKLGYLWAFINATFLIGVFWIAREMVGYHPPHGMSTPVFLVCGFIPWYLFSKTVNAAVNAVNGNLSLLGYPQVFPIDILIARTLLQGAMSICVMVFLLSLAEYLDYPIVPSDPYSMLMALSLSLLFGFGFGATCSSLNLLWPTTARILPMALRIMFFISGLFYSVAEAPYYARRFLFYNPLSHLVELLRSSMSLGYNSHYIFLPYVVGAILVFVTLGLLLERYSRRFLGLEV